MKISSKLPQFENEKALVAVIGQQGFVFYLVSRGMLKKAREVRIERFRFTFTPKQNRRAGSSTAMPEKISWQAVQLLDPERIENEVMKVFTRELSTATALLKAPAGIYIFSTVSALCKVKEIPPAAARKVKAVFKGNFQNSHPFVLLEKIAAYSGARQARPVGGEAPGILAGGLIG